MVPCSRSNTLYFSDAVSQINCFSRKSRVVLVITSGQLIGLPGQLPFSEHHIPSDRVLTYVSNLRISITK